jgi:hypothetical protein
MESDAITRSPFNCERLAITVLAMPSPRYSRFGSPLALANGSTAIDRIGLLLIAPLSMRRSPPSSSAKAIAMMTAIPAVHPAQSHRRFIRGRAVCPLEICPDSISCRMVRSFFDALDD